MSDAVKIETALICDEVRKEDNGKLIIVGLYATNIRFTVLPAAGVFTFLVIAQALKTGDHDVQFRVKLADTVLYESKGGQIHARQPGRVLVPLPNIIIEADKEAMLTLEANTYQEGWELVSSVPVQGPDTNAPSTASEQPSSRSPSAASKKSSKP